MKKCLRINVNVFVNNQFIIMKVIKCVVKKIVPLPFSFTLLYNNLQINLSMYNNKQL